MRSIAPSLACVVALAACQGPQSAEAPQVSMANPARAQVRPHYEVCGSRGFNALQKQGGVQRVPHIAKEKQFMGEFSYAPITAPGPVLGLVFSCPTSDQLAPIPQGYTPDWFGSWTLYCKKDGDGNCTGLTFGNANLTGEITSNVWTASRTYYLYVYTDDTEQYIESYQIGPVTKGTHGNYELTFNAPFKNGLQYPADEGFALEIVHPSGE